MRKASERVLSLLLVLCMVIGMLPASAFASTNSENETSLSTALSEAKAYIDGLTVNNSGNDPATVVSKWETEFSWDNEKRESNNKDYLFEWSYYNGVVFEGLDYVYDATGNATYSKYVTDYLSTMITETGHWATCSDSSKECAGYNASHGADCYKTASLLLDYYKLTGDSRYLTIAKTLYTDLQNAQSRYTFSDRGGNYNHTWSSTPTYAVWLDGLYMIQPFMAEYASYTNDSDELEKIAARFAWIGENMYNKSTELYYHAANSSSSYYNNSGSYWGRAIGWYAAAMVDVMSYMPDDDVTAMKTQLKKLVDGMQQYQTDDGMWRQFVNVSSSTKETSVTALMAYAIQKAVNNGWLDSSYAEYAQKAFVGICDYALDDRGLHYICYKGSTSSYSEPVYDEYVNEGKGVGPFIMAYAEMLNAEEGTTEKETEKETTETETSKETVEDTEKEDTTAEFVTKSDESTGVSVSAEEITGLTVTEVSNIASTVSSVLKNAVAYDITVTGYTTGSTASVTLPVPAGVINPAVYYVAEDGNVEKMTIVDNTEDTVTFNTTHFSTYAVGEDTAITTTEWVKYSGGTVYKNVESLESDNPYVIIYNGYALSGTASGVSLTSVTITENDDGTYSITNSEGSITTWYMDSEKRIYCSIDGAKYYLKGTYTKISKKYTLSVTDSEDSAAVWTVSGEASNIIFTTTVNSKQVYLRYSNNSNNFVIGINSSSSNFTVYSQEIREEGQARLKGQLTQNIIVNDGTTQEDILNEITVEWDSDLDNSADTNIDIADCTVSGTYDNTIAGTYELTIFYNDKELGSIEIIVTEKEIANVDISDSNGEVVRGSKNSASTGDYIIITYADGTEAKVAITLDMISGEYDISNEGTYTDLVVTYGTYTFDEYTLTVNPKEGNNFPEYPEAGSVDVNKVIGDSSQFQNTGVAEVQLSTSGIPVQTGVDVVLTIDISNSMAWATGTTSSDGYAENNKLDEVMAAVENFANIFLADNEDGTSTKNTITIVTFAGYDAENWNGSGSYIDSIRTLVTATNSIEVVEKIAEGTYFTDADTITISYIPADKDQNTVSNITSESGDNRGDTNYDYAFWQTAQAISDGALGGENRESYVLFMTDGCASNFNDYYYRSKNVSYYYCPGTETTYSYYVASDGTAWTDYILNTLIPESSGNKYAKDVYEMVDDMYAIGFDMAHGSFSGLSTWDSSVDWESVFNNIVSKVVVDDDGNGLIDVTAASDTKTLNTFYESLARELRYAATDAYFVDQMGEDFDIQLASYVTKFDESENQYSVSLNPAPVITVSSYNVYTANDVDGTNITTSMIGEKYGNATIIETVAFNAEGTEAYSSVDGYDTSTKTVNNVTVTEHSGNTNILHEDGVIYANTFWYNTTSSPVMIDTDGDDTLDYSLPAETFYWNIGTINETEFVLSYYVYLEGACEGEAAAGTYDTNNYATLYYTNWLDNHVSQSVQSPSLAWESAQVSYGFYLVDKDGNPVTNQTTGATGSFYDAVKVTQAVLYSTIELNSEDTVKISLLANTVIPEGYSAYDPYAAYTIVVDSNNTASGWTIVVGENLNATTYVTDYSGSLASNETSESEDSYDYTATTVWFAVVWTPQCIPDTVVIDYGLPVDISVLANDMFGNYGTLNGIGKKSPLAEDVKYQTGGSSEFDTSLDATYGTANVNGSKVRYTPSNMEMNSYDQFAYEVKYTVGGSETDLQYYYGTVTVIPATTIYYEDDFLTLKSYTVGNDADNDGNDDEDKPSRWTTKGTGDSNATQDEDRPGYYSLSSIDANNVYGYDSAYTACSQYSLGSAKMVTVDANSYATASFSFYGTGFDVISMTDTTTGTLFAKVTDANGTSVRNIIVDTYYGYAYGEYEDSEGNIVEGWHIVDSNDPNAIYQVPVITVEGLEYGLYNVVLTASYSEYFNNVGDTSYDLYLDAVRIYDPANDGAESNIIKNAYVADNEGWPIYQELRDNVIDAATLDSESKIVKVNGIVFMDGVGESAIVSNYTNYGPNNELYLAPGQAIVFELEEIDNIDTVQLGIKSAADGKEVSYKIFDGSTIKNQNDLNNVTTLKVATATDMYYDITKLKDSAIVVYNSGSDGYLSLTNIKMTFTTEPTNVIENLFYVSSDVIKAITNNMNTEIFEPTTFDITYPTSVSVGDNITITVKTKSDVAAISVNGEMITTYSTSDQYCYWTAKVSTSNVGTENISVIAYNEDGVASETKTVSVTVEELSTSETTAIQTIIKLLKELLGWIR